MVKGLGTGRSEPRELADAVRPDIHRMHIALLAQSRSGAVRAAIARRDDIPFGVQAALAHDDEPEVRGVIASNPRTAASVMHLLLEDSHHAVLFELARNPSCPRDVAVRLAAHRRADVRNAAIRRLETREAVDATPVLDPDWRVPELRDRVSAPVERATAHAARPFGEGAASPLHAPLSALAQRIGVGQGQARAYRSVAVQTDFWVSPAS